MEENIKTEIQEMEKVVREVDKEVVSLIKSRLPDTKFVVYMSINKKLSNGKMINPIMRGNNLDDDGDKVSTVKSLYLMLFETIDKDIKTIFFDLNAVIAGNKKENDTMVR